MNFLEGVEFNVMQPVGVNVVAFLIGFTNKEQWNNLPLCTLEKLSYAETAVDGRIQRTFSIPYSNENEGSNIVILSLTKTRCVIGYGQIENEKFKTAEETIQLDYMNYGQSEVEARNYTFTYNPKRQIVILDTDSGEQLIPSISAPDMFGNLKGTYKLIPYKNYVALEMNINIRVRKTKDMEELGNTML